MSPLALSPGERRVAALAAGLALLLALCRPMHAEDATVLFNRVNHFGDESAFFHYAGYISAAPQAIAYVTQILPDWLQALTIMGAAGALFVAAAVAMHRAAEEDWRITAMFIGGSCFMAPLHLMNLSYSIWTAVALAMIALQGAMAGTCRFGLWGLAATLVAAMSNPAAIFLFPAFAAAAALRRDPMLALGATAMLALPLALRESGGGTFAGLAETFGYLGRVAADLAGRIAAGDPGSVLRALPLVLIGLGAWAALAFLRQLRRGDAEALTPLLLLAGGGGVLAFAMISVRVVGFDDVPPRYAYPLFVACLIAAMRLPAPRMALTVAAVVAMALGGYRGAEYALRLPQGLATHAALIDPGRWQTVLHPVGDDWALFRGAGDGRIADCPASSDARLSTQGVVSFIVRDEAGRWAVVNCGQMD